MIQQDATFQQVLDLFSNAESGLLNLALEQLDQYNPNAAEPARFPDERSSGSWYVDHRHSRVPPGAEMILNPKAFQNRSAEDLNSASGENHVTVELDALKAANVLKLLSGQDADLVSLDIRQSFRGRDKDPGRCGSGLQPVWCGEF